MARKQVEEEVAPPEDPTSFLVDSDIALFLLMHTKEIKYMCILAYTFFHGIGLFNAIDSKASFSFKFISFILKCTGGGIMVPVLINGIPVPLAIDAYPISILISFALHTYFPILREVFSLSSLFKAAVIVLFETMRAFVVTKFTGAAGSAIAPSDFDFPVFGPIFCGTISGCGGAFLPFNKGLDPIKDKGLAPPMFSAFVGATFYHLFLNTSLSEGVIEPQKKAQVVVAIWFILYSYYKAGLFNFLTAKPKKNSKSNKKIKKENKKDK